MMDRMLERSEWMNVGSRDRVSETEAIEVYKNLYTQLIAEFKISRI